MRSFYLDGLLAFLLCLGLTWCMRELAIRMGWLNRPAPPRNAPPARAVPRVGGVAVLAATLVAIALLRFWEARFDRPNFLHQAQLRLIVLPALLVFLVGLWDDIRPLRWWQKLTVETVAAAWAAWLGLRVHLFIALGHKFPFALSYIVSILWLLACANSMNLIDGLDGLASGIALLATLTLMIAGIVTGNLALVILTLPLAGALLAFLLFNFNPATIYLGDSGSLTIGFLLGIFGILWSEKSTTILALTIPVFALALPLMDSGVAMVRRWLMGAPVFVRDRGHLHHRLQGLGISPRRVVLLLYGLSAVFALASLSLLPRYYAGLGPAVLAISALIWFGIQTLGYEGMQQSSSQLHQRVSLRRATADLVELQHLSDRLGQQSNRDDLWLQLCGMAAFVGALRCQLEWRQPGGDFERDCWLEAPAPLLWEVYIPLAAGGHRGSLRLGFTSKPSLTGVAAASVVELLSRTVAPALAELSAPATVSALGRAAGQP